MFIGWWELLIIAFIFLLLFGGKKIPELMKSLGSGIKSFKEGINETEEMVNKAGESKATEDKKDDNSKV